MMACGAFRPARPTRWAGWVALAIALAFCGALASCGETRGLLLGDVPAALDAAPSDADVGSICSPCTIPVVLSGSSTTAEQGGDGGVPHLDLCPDNEVLLGFQGTLTLPSAGLTLVEGFQATCGELTLASAPPAAISTTTGSSLPMRGASKGSAWSQVCPANQVVVGFSGRSGSDLDQVAFDCAAWTAASDEAGTPLSMGTPVTLPAAGGDGGLPFQGACPPGQLARGTNGRFGQWVNAFALVCATPTLAAADAGP